jgi:hypothetical protein
MSGLMLFEFLAEARIEQAIAQGMLDNLPGAGQPLVLADDRLVPEGLRVAYRILMNARCVPPEVEARREVAALVASLATLDDDAALRRTLAKVALLKARLEASGLRRNRRSTASGRRPGRLGNGALES